MIPFFTKYPDLAVNETRTITVQGRDDLLDGEYGFIEFYCDEIDCDCRRVIINVVTATTEPKIWATINFGWEDVEFYEKWIGDKENAVDCKGPYLDPMNPQTKYSPVLLRIFEHLLTDVIYLERLKKHYELFKSSARTKNSSEQKTEYRSQRKKRRGKKKGR